MDSKETLFSLELAVESLRIHSSAAVCRLPAVAFRLLDFPTLLIHHIDPNEAQRIKDTIILDSFGDIPNQLHELKDHRGNFRINKCKSSLFKMNPKILLAYLRNTPLYLMLIDVWPEVPKLVANCTVSLQSTMEKISEDIEQNGIDVPSVHGHRDSHKLYNLMGSEVGWIILRYRLLSMGASLIPHIPEMAVAKRGAETVDLTVTPRKIKDDATVANDAKMAKEDKDVVLEDLEVQGHPKMISVAISTIDDLSRNLKTEQPDQKQQATQTEKHSKQASHHRKAASLMPLKPNDDLVINNTHCPPPLFFNIASEDRAASQRQFVNMTKRGNTEQIHTNKYNVETDDPGSKHDSSVELSSSSSQLLSEDITHETEMYYKYPAADQTGSQSWSVRKTHWTLRTEKPKTEKADKHRLQSGTGHEIKEQHQFGTQKSLICNRCQLEVDPSHSQLPILGALLQELSLLHGNALHQTEPVASPKIPTQKEEICTSSNHQETDANRSSPRDEKENTFISGPKDELKVKPYRHKHRECAKPPKSVPSTKGWLRQQQPVQKPKRGSTLQYAMTHSQKLRLRKNNPEVLKEMELKELKMQELQREKERKKLMKKQQKDLAETASKHDVSTEIAHHYEVEDGELNSPTGHRRSMFEKEKDATAKNADDYDWSNGAVFTSEQPPIAAPRRPKGSTYVWEADAPCLNTAAENGLISMAGNKNKQDSGTEVSQVSKIRHRRESMDFEEPKDISNSEKSARSIAIYLPSASVHESDSGSNSDGSTDTDSQFSSAPSYVKQPKAVRIPGLPSDKDVSDEDSHNESNIQYSDDFVESDDFGSTGERELAPLKSTRSDSDHSIRSSTSDESKSSSVTTTKSQISPKAKSPEPRPYGKPSNSQPRRLSIPKPKLSSISPIPVRKSSKTSSASITTVGRDAERSLTPPTPRPRSSLLKSASSFSENSLLQSTVPSSEFKTEDSQKASQKESYDSYSFNFDNSGVR